MGRETKKHRRTLYQIFFRDKHTKTMGVILLLAAGIALWQEISWIIPEKVTILYAGMDGKTEKVVAETREDMVEGVLKESDIANDCGGAVKDHIVDLYMRSTQECIRWGRQNRKAYILEK